MRKYAFYLLWVLVFTMPCDVMFYVQGVGTISKFVGVLAAGMMMAALLSRGRLRQFHPFMWLHLAFVLWAAFSYFWTLDQLKYIERLVTHTQLFVLVWMVWELARDETSQRSLLQAYVLGATVMAFSVVYGFITGASVSVGTDRFTGFDQDPNYTAFMVAWGVPCAWYLLFKGTWQPLKLFRFLNIAVLPVLCLAVLLTASRSGFLALSIGLLFIPISSAIRGEVSFRRRANAITMVAVFGLASLVFVPPESYERLLTIADEVNTAQSVQSGQVRAEASGMSRLYIWERGIEAFTETPIVGVGLGGFRKSIATIERTGGDAAHNSYLLILVELGVIGFGLCCLIIAMLFFATSSMRPMERAFYILMLLMWLCVVMFIQQDYEKHTWFVFALIVAHAASADERRRAARRALRAAARAPMRQYQARAGAWSGRVS